MQTQTKINKKQKTMKTIKANTTISARFIGDSNLVVTAQVLDRKGDFVTLKVQGEKNIVRKKVKVGFDGNEYVMAMGSYSMAPIFM